MPVARVALAVAVAVASLAGCARRAAPPEAIVGVPRPETTVAMTTVPAPPEPPEPLPAPDTGARPAPEPGPTIGLVPANGRPFRPAIPFTTAHPVPPELQFILVVGSDARPGEDIRRARADSIHLLAVNPRTRQGTLVGFPRDSYVEIPGSGKGKINDALARGGPDLLAETVRRVSGLPVHYYVLTGFAGLRSMVDRLGGVDVYVARRMNDRMSGARFEPGWHRFNGNEALAYSRNRNDVPYGDFSRSMHQGDVILAALAKMRAEVADDAGVRAWLQVLLGVVALDVPRDRLPVLGALARRLDPTRLENLVLPGRVGTAGRQSVVFLAPEASEVFRDLRDDAVRGEAGPEIEDTETTTTTTTTTTTAPSPSTPPSTPVDDAP